MSSGTINRPARPARRTELTKYPGDARRYLCLGIVVVATIVLYYQFYLAGAVAAGTNGKNGILVDTKMSFVYYVNIAVVGYIFGAAASFVSGVADKYGRVNIVSAGLVVVGLLCLIGIPLTDTSKVGFAIVFGAIGLVEGIILVATPALIRDFSPQLGRASAMGFWTLGPVIGSLIVSIQVSSTSNSFAWHKQYIIAGIVGLVVAVLSVLFLRELSPQLRDQLMVSERDRALIEARAAGIDVEASLRHPFRQMLKPDIILSAFSISVFLIIYYVAVGFFPVFFQTIFGYSQTKANGLGNYVWAFDALALLVIGYLSDKIRVRKPFMVVGAVGAIVMTVIFATRATHPSTSYTAFAVILSVLAVFLGVAYAPWMASFTESVEKRNPALAATGLAIWGLVIRIVIAVSVFIVPHVVNTVTTLVQDGGPVAAAKGAVDKAHPGLIDALQKHPDVPANAQAYGAKYGTQLATAAKIDPTTAAALGANPNDTAAQAKAVSDISGVSVADVVTVGTLQATRPKTVAALATLDQGTALTLLNNPNDQAAGAKAVGEITSKLHITPADAIARLTDARSIPKPQLVTLGTQGPKVAAGATALKSVATIPPAVTTFFTKTGPAEIGAKNFAALTTDKATQANLAALNTPTAKKVAAAAKKSPKQWQHYFWIAVGGEVVFIPMIFLLVGAWSPKRARREEQEHEAMVEAELAKLGS